MPTKNKEALEVATSTLHANPWNPNVMDERTFEAARESIREFGFLDPVLVRPHPEIEGEWEIIDGEHRWRGAIEEGLDKVTIIPRDLSDAAARRLTIILNETRGEADVAKLGTLLAGLTEEMEIEDVLRGLALSERELAQLTEIGRADWDNFEFSGEQRSTGNVAAQIVELRFDDEQRERFKRLVDHLRRELELASAEEVVLSCLDTVRSA